MAAMSAAHPTTTTLTPPSSSHGNQSWNYSAPDHAEVSMQDRKISSANNNEIANDVPLRTQNGGFNPSPYTLNGEYTSSRKMASHDDFHALKGSRSAEEGFLSPLYDSANEKISNGLKPIVSSPAESLVDPYSAPRNGKAGGDRRTASDNKSGEGVKEDSNSKWIHRDKLARIESEELQAAGIILPRQRWPSRSRRDYRSNDALNGSRKTSDTALATLDQNQTRPARSRKNSVEGEAMKPQDIQIPSWDLRTPEEIAAEAGSGFHTPNGLSKGATKIPVAKLSPVPIPLQHLERDSPMPRKPTANGLGEGDGIAFPKLRARSASMKMADNPNVIHAAKRSATDGMSPSKRPTTENTSPKKAAVGGTARKLSTKGGPAGSRPKTRSGPNKDSTSSSGTRPSTRSGELKQPEGEPPWMISAYTPDPRLPPDKQLLPTVARRLQQEQWEKEGKFGSVYDRDFRPLNDDDPFVQQPVAELPPPPPQDEQQQPGPSAVQQERQRPDEWPLRTETGRKSPRLRIANSYSTMPKIQDKHATSPAQSPRGQLDNNFQLQPLSPLSPQDIVRMPEQPEPQREKKGCGCCIVM